MKRPTITQLAEELGVAPSTVSRAFTRPHLLMPETVHRVREAAARVGYTPNNNARALSTGKAGAIGLIVPDIANPFFPPLIRAAQARADEAGLAVFLADSAENAEREAQLITRLAPQVEGLVVASSRVSSTKLRELAKGQSLAFISRDVSYTFRVLLDTTLALTEALDHLTEQGHVEIAYVGGPALSWYNKQRQNTVAAYAQTHRVRIHYFDADPGTYAVAQGLSKAVIESGATAIVAFDDVVAHGLMGGMAAHGIRLPDQMSIIGCDDTLAITTFPPLSTISVRLEDAARTAVEAMIKPRSGNSVEPARVVLPGDLVLRGTTAPPSPCSSSLPRPRRR